MATTSTLNRVTQIGMEVTPGTLVAATKKLQMIDLQTAANPTFQSYPGTARRFNVAHALNQQQSVLKLGGKFNYTEMVYVYSNMYGAATITTPVGATLARNWKWQIPLSGSITRKTWSIEEGDSIAARTMAYGLLSGWGFKADRESEIALSGDGVAYGQTGGATLTGSLSAVPQIPLLGKHINIYADNTWAGIGGTQLSKPMQTELKWSKDNDVYWTMNRSNTSFAEHVDMPPAVDLSLMYPNDATAASLMTDALANTTKYVRFEAIGDKIEVGSGGPDQFYTTMIDIPCRITKVDSDADQKGVRVRTFHFTPIEDSTAGFGAVIQVVNTQTAL